MGLAWSACWAADTTAAGQHAEMAGAAHDAAGIAPMGAAIAGGMKNTDPGKRFAAMDADSNGSISREEFFKARPMLTQQAFDAIDADHNGAICSQEWLNFSSGHGSTMKGAGMGGQIPPEMAEMMKSMRGMGGARPAEGSPAAGTDSHVHDEVGRSSGSMMPLVMPPREGAAESAPAGNAMPLVMPPSSGATRTDSTKDSMPLIMPPTAK